MRKARKQAESEGKGGKSKAEEGCRQEGGTSGGSFQRSERTPKPRKLADNDF